MTGHHRKKGAQRGTRTPESGKVVRQTVIPLGPELDKRCLAYRGRGGDQVWYSPEEFMRRYCNWDTQYYKNGGVRK